MTIKTLSLLLLFVVGFGTSAVLVAALQALGPRAGVSTPGVVPVAALLCYTATFFLGRRHILPARMAATPALALAALSALTAASMGLSYGLIWLLQRFLGGIPGAAALLVWFLTLWCGTAALERADRAHPRVPLS